MNYIYGTWSVLCALNAIRLDQGSPETRRAVDWLAAIQNADGGWGEDGTSYKLDYRGYEAAPSTASQTAWALLGLMAAGEVDHPSVGARCRLSAGDTAGPTDFGTKRATPRPGFHACSICATTATRNSFRCGRWRAIGTSKAATHAGSTSACDEDAPQVRSVRLSRRRFLHRPGAVHLGELFLDLALEHVLSRALGV